ncbi:short-chain dehydrogenase/reductase SDR [Parafrankia sp. EAN1pec]|uniref:SDR family oxidoreductase n=1 Tax=Parafrankia sp. (strain EAN1pec) TaxID=298653 RepID=UPI0000540819|nr:short-chain dehydrogenase/reductase SDR [Frankia sp. EAN1pec]
MTLLDTFSYRGKRAVVVGGASGMGAAAALLVQQACGATVVMDYADVTLADATAMHVDLADRTSIDAAVDQCGGPVDALFMCAGAAEGTPGIERINFVGHRHLIERMLAKDLLPRGSAICFISSAAGLGWEKNFTKISELLDIVDFDEAARLMRDTGTATYLGTKQAVCAYVAREALRFLQHGIRINAICPGPTDTPLAQANRDTWLEGGSDYRAKAGIRPSTPAEQAYPMLFLCSDAAVSITGITLLSDAGWLTAGITGSFPGATAITSILLNRSPVYQQGD